MWRATRLLVLGSMVAAASTIWAQQAQQHIHFPNSEWRLDMPASDFVNDDRMQSSVFTIHTDNEKWFAWDHVMVDGDGKTWKGSWAGPPDGTMKPVTGAEGLKAGFRAKDNWARYEMGDGSWSEGIVNSSDDRKTNTIHVKGETKDGKDYTQTLVFRRVK